MSRYTATDARRELFHLLDAVEAGEEIIVERRGTRFRITLDRESPPTEPPPSPLRVLDESLLTGEWSWRTNEDGELELADDER